MELGEKAAAEERMASEHAVVNFMVDYLFFFKVTCVLYCPV